MRARRDALFLLAGSGVSDLAFRIAQVALPLVVLHETGSVAATGLAGGASGIPVLLSPWWARRARQWVDSGPRLATVACVQAFALAMIPAAAALGVLRPEVLIVGGLLLGAVMRCRRLGGPRSWRTRVTSGDLTGRFSCSPGRTGSGGSAW
jgi:hypothetical protein